MQLAIHFTLLEHLIETFRDTVRSCANARYAAMDRKRLNAMSDAELAYRGLAREDIAAYVQKRYMD